MISNKRWRSWTVLLLCMIQVSLCFSLAFAQTAPFSKPVIRVGYWDDYHTVQMVDGIATGFAPEYFAEIGKYSDVQYEFVMVDSIDEGLAELEKGTIDLFGPVLQTDERQEKCLYSDAFGYEQIYLASLQSKEIALGDVDEIAQHIIGVKKGSAYKSLLENYFQKNGFSDEMVLETEEEFTTGKGYSLILTTALQLNENDQLVDMIGLEQFYYVAQKDNESLIKEINRALSNISITTPAFFENLFVKYFVSINYNKPTLTQDDYALLAEDSPYVVGYNANQAPFSYLSSSGEIKGISIEVMNEIARDGGIKVIYVPISQNDADNPYMDINLSTMTSSSIHKNQTQSDAYARIPLMLVAPENENGFEGKKIGYIDYHAITDEMLQTLFKGGVFIPFCTTGNLAQALKNGQVDYSLSTSLSVKEIADTVSQQGYMMLSVGEELELELTFAHDMPKETIEVFNKLVNRLDEAVFNALTIDAVYGVDENVDLYTWIIEHQMAVFFGVVGLLTLISLIVTLMGRSKQVALTRSINEDPLTNLLSEKKIQEEILKKLTHIRKDDYSQSTSEEHYALVSIDVVNFKYINELFSYDVGTQVLQLFAKQLQQCCHPSDLVARIHADTFLVFTKGGKRLDVLMERLKRQFVGENEMTKILKGRYKCQISAGIYLIEDVDIDLSHMIDCAGMARNSGKKEHGNHFVMFSQEMQKAVEVKNEITANMENGVLNHEFVMVYQPKISLQTGEIVGSEALVRWMKHGKMIAPNDFIPIFEQNGFIVRLDYYVFETVCAFLQKHKKLDIPRISVNLSGITILEEDLISHLIGITKKYGVLPSELDLEITESAIITNFDTAIDKMKCLRTLGFSVSLDDFGTGISTLSRLKDIDIDILKIDRAFLGDALSEEKGVCIVDGIVKLSQGLHIETVAEGIETSKELDMLKQFGCDVGQGYYFYRPLDERNFLALFEEKCVSK